MKTKQEMIDYIKSIGTCSDESERLSMLLNLESDMGEVFDQHDQLQTMNANLTTENKKVKEANMALFLKVGQQSEPNPEPKPEPKTTLSYENLFNEKGALKL